MPVLGGKTLAALMIAATAASAKAQKACEPDEGVPNQVSRAVLDIQIAQQPTTKPADAALRLKDAIKLLGEADPKRNPVGRNFVTGKALTIWMAQPNMAEGFASRGSLGFTTDTSVKYDLIAGIDSAFSVVEASNPDCAAVTDGWRRQKPWVDLVQKAVELGNTGADSAGYYATRSLMLSRKAPYGYLVLAQVAAKAHQEDAAISNYKSAIATATDTAQADQRRQFILLLGNYTTQLAAADTVPAAKAAHLADAKSAFEQLAKDPGTKYADIARTGTAQLASISGDTAAMKGAYADQLANPSAFSYASLMSAAVTAAHAGQTKDAIKLFESARAVNPYHRDVLYNLARLYLLDSNYTQGVLYSKQLLQIDPSNSDNDQIAAIAYNAIQKSYASKSKELEAKSKAYGAKANTSKSPAVVKASVDSAARLAPILKAYEDSNRVFVDSAIKYNDLYMKAPTKVVFTEFSPGDGKTTIGGSIANLTDAAKTYSLKIDFVDKSGAVVSTQTVSVGPVDSHHSMTFTATATGAGIVAFRYAPVS